MVLAEDLKSENMGEFYRLEKEENGLFKRENKGECCVGEGRGKDYLKERIRESAGQEKEEKGVFKRENKGECWVG